MNIYDIAIPQMTRTLGQVRRWLDKARAYAEQKKFDPEVLLAARLAPDQWPLAQQIKVLTLAPRRLAAVLRGQEPPAFDEGEVNLKILADRLDASIASLKALRAEEFRGADDRVIPLFFMPGKGMSATEFVITFSLPNFYFHVNTAYSILRHNGVDLGKMDYIGELNVRDM